MLNLRPQETVSETDLQTGLRMLMFDGVCTQIMGTLAGGAFLVAYALILGASNFYIGLIAALGPLAQMLQILIFLGSWNFAINLAAPFFFWSSGVAIRFLWPSE